MNVNRREFMGALGATATAAFAFQGTDDVFWTPEPLPDAGWTAGIEERLTSTCLICPSRCGITGRMVDGRLVRIMGNPLHPMNRGGVCPRGLAGMQMLYHPERLASPLVRAGTRGMGGWSSVSRGGAINLIAERLGTLRGTGRPHALALVSGHCAGTMQDLWGQFLSSFGSPNHIRDDYQDGTDAVMRLMHGFDRRPAFDLERAGTVFSFGAPLFESWWAPLQAFVAFAAGGDDGRRRRFVQIDTRFSRTAARSHEWVGVRPGTHAVLALGLAYVMIRDELFDADFVAEHVAGFEDFTDDRNQLREGYRSIVSRNYRTEEVSAITGVPVERITSLARAFAEGRPALAVWGSDVTHAPDGLLGGLAVHSLNVLVGSINEPGTVLVADDPPLEPLPPAILDQTARDGLARTRIGSRSPFGEGNEALRFAEAVAGAPDQPIDALLLYYSNPLASSSHPEVWQAALDKIPFVVSFSPFLDETTRHADLILPDLTPYERWQDAPAPRSYPYPIWGVTRPLVQPQGEGIHTGDAVLAVARLLGGGVSETLPFEDFLTLLQTRAKGLFAARRGATFGDDFERNNHRQMEERGWWLPEYDDFDSFWQDMVRRGGWMDLFYDHTDPARLADTPSGRIDLMPVSLLRALEEDTPDRQPYRVVAPTDTPAASEFPLRLIPYRVSTLASGTLALERWMAERPGLFPNVHWEPWVEVHPATARGLGLEDGSAVWIVSSRHRYRARVMIFPGTAPENVCVPYGLRHPDGELANPLQLLEERSDPLTGLAAWHTTFVRLERA